MEHTFVRAPLDVRAAAGVNKVDPLLADVRKIEPVELLAAQFEDAVDFLSAEADDLEAAIREHARQTEPDILHGDVEPIGQTPENPDVDAQRVRCTEEREDCRIQVWSAWGL